MKTRIAILTLLLCLFSLPALAQAPALSQDLDEDEDVQFDVQPVQIRLSMRVIRLVHESNGALKLETVGTPVIITLNRQTAIFTTQAGKEGYTIEITPQVNADGSLLLIGKMSATLAGNMKATNVRIALDGSTIMLLGVTNSTRKDTQASVQRGELSVGGTEKHTDYYLQITPTVVSAQPHPIDALLP